MRPIITALMLSMACVPGIARAADTGQLPCATTAECKQQAAKVGAAPVALGSSATSKTDQAEDQFYWLNKINRASAVMLVEEEIVAPELGRKLASGVNFTIEQAAKPDGKGRATCCRSKRSSPIQSVPTRPSFIRGEAARHVRQPTGWRTSQPTARFLRRPERNARARAGGCGEERQHDRAGLYQRRAGAAHELCGLSIGLRSLVRTRCGAHSRTLQAAQSLRDGHRRARQFELAAEPQAHGRAARLRRKSSRTPSTPARSARPTFRSRRRRSSRPTRSASARC